MAIKLVEPIKSEMTEDTQGHRLYESEYLVTATLDIDPVTIRQDSRVPQRGDKYKWLMDPNLTAVEDEWAYCSQVKLSMDPVRIKDFEGEPALLWTISTTHTTKLDLNYPIFREDPLDDPPIIDGGFAPFRKFVYRDKDGNQIQNTARFPLLDPVEIDDAYDTLKISFKTAKIDLGLRQEYRGAVNSTPIWGLTARQVKLTAWRWKSVRIREDDYYVQHDLEFIISLEQMPDASIVHSSPNYGGKKGWYTVRENKGDKYYLGGAATGTKLTLYNFVTRQGEEYTDWLKSDGDEATSVAQRGYLVFAVEPEKDFTLIPGLPHPLLPGPFE